MPKRNIGRRHIMMAGLRSIDAQGGIETHVRELATRLAERDVLVEVVERKPYADVSKYQRREVDGVVRSPLWSLRSQSFEAVSGTFAAVLWSAWRRPMVLHIHGIGPALLTPLAKLLGLRVVVTHHGRDYNREKWGTIAKIALKAGEWSALTFADEVIAVSSRLSQELSKTSSRNVHGIPNGVSKTANSGTSTGGFDFPYILSVGRIVPEKRHLDLMRAFLAIDRGDVHLVIAGGADHETAYSSEVQRLASSSPHVHLLGAIPWVQVQKLYTDARLFVIPSTHEGLPIALLEAMASGCDVIASDISPHLEVGLPARAYFTVGDVNGLCEKLTEALDRPSNRVDWGAELERFDWNTIVDQTMQVYGVS